MIHFLGHVIPQPQSDHDFRDQCTTEGATGGHLRSRCQRPGPGQPLTQAQAPAAGPTGRAAEPGTGCAEVEKPGPVTGLSRYGLGPRPSEAPLQVAEIIPH